MDLNSQVWARTSKSILRFLDFIKNRTKVLFNDSRASNSIDSLKHCRNVPCVFLFYNYYNALCAGKLGNPVHENHVFMLLSHRALSGKFSS